MSSPSKNPSRPRLALECWAIVGVLRPDKWKSPKSSDRGLLGELLFERSELVDMVRPDIEGRIRGER
jgi:hypothetical protein